MMSRLKMKKSTSPDVINFLCLFHERNLYKYIKQVDTTTESQKIQQ